MTTISIDSIFEQANQHLANAGIELVEARRKIRAANYIIHLSNDEEFMAQLRDIETRIKAGEVFEGIPADKIGDFMDEWRESGWSDEVKEKYLTRG